MNEDDAIAVEWASLQPTTRQRRRMDARVAAWLEARDASLASEWLDLFRVAPVAATALVAVSVVAIATALPLAWIARTLL